MRRTTSARQGRARPDGDDRDVLRSVVERWHGGPDPRPGLVWPDLQLRYQWRRSRCERSESTALLRDRPGGNQRQSLGDVDRVLQYLPGTLVPHDVSGSSVSKIID